MLCDSLRLLLAHNNVRVVAVLKYPILLISCGNVRRVPFHQSISCPVPE
jgi:hypothetical protein